MAKGQQESASRGDRRRRLSREARRAELLRSGLEAFATRGVRRTGHGDVAKVAGCAVSTVFLYFPTRDDLVDAVLGEVERFYREMAEEVHASTDDARVVVIEHARRFRASLESHPDHALVLLNWAANVRSRVWPRYLAMLETLIAMHRETIERGIEEGSIAPSVDGEAAARAIVGYAQTSIQLRLADPDARRQEQLSSRMIGALLSPARQEDAA